MQETPEKTSLSAQDQLDIQKYVSSVLKEWLGWIGAINLIFLIGAMTYVFFVLPDKAASEASRKIEDKLSTYINALEQKIPQVFEKSGRLEERLEGIETAAKAFRLKNDELKRLFAQASEDLAEIKGKPEYQVAETIRALNQASEAKEIVSKLQELNSKMAVAASDIENLRTRLDEEAKDLSNRLITVESRFPANVRFQDNWKWDRRTQALFYTGGGRKFLPVYPAGGGGKPDFTGSGNYVLLVKGK